MASNGLSPLFQRLSFCPRSLRSILSFLSPTLARGMANRAETSLPSPCVSRHYTFFAGVLSRCCSPPILCEKTKCFAPRVCVLSAAGRETASNGPKALPNAVRPIPYRFRLLVLRRSSDRAFGNVSDRFVSCCSSSSFRLLACVVVLHREKKKNASSECVWWRTVSELGTMSLFTLHSFVLLAISVGTPAVLGGGGGCSRSCFWPAVRPLLCVCVCLCFRGVRASREEVGCFERPPPPAGRSLSRPQQQQQQ